MSFVSRIIPESFRHIGELILPDARIIVEMGDIEQNDVLHLDMALKINVSFKTVDTQYNCIFKGHNMIDKACEWLFMITEGEFTFNDVGPQWLKKLVASNHEGKLQHD